MKSVKRAAVARRRRCEDPVRLSRTIRAFSRISRLDLGTAPPHDTGEKLLREVCRALDLKRAEIWLIGPNDHHLAGQTCREYAKRKGRWVFVHRPEVVLI